MFWTINQLPISLIDNISDPCEIYLGNLVNNDISKLIKLNFQNPKNFYLIATKS